MPVAEPPAFGLLPRPVRVLRRQRETHDTATLSLEANGRPWLPGQFAMLYAYGVGEVPSSIGGDPGQAARLEHTIRATGVVGSALCRLRRGQWVGVRGPFGSAWPLAGARGGDVLLVAEGLGLAALRPALYAVLRSRRDYGRVTLACGARSPTDLLFPREVERWLELGAFDVLLTVDVAADGWRWDVGGVASLLRHAAFDPCGGVAMVCGPETMMQCTIAELRRLGLPETAIWISIERRMLCVMGPCRQCQAGRAFVCRQGPVFRLNEAGWMLGLKPA